MKSFPSRELGSRRQACHTGCFRRILVVFQKWIRSITAVKDDFFLEALPRSGLFPGRQRRSLAQWILPSPPSSHCILSPSSRLVITLLNIKKSWEQLKNDKIKKKIAVNMASFLFAFYLWRLEGSSCQFFLHGHKGYKCIFNFKWEWRLLHNHMTP